MAEARGRASRGGNPGTKIIHVRIKDVGKHDQNFRVIDSKSGAKVLEK